MQNIPQCSFPVRDKLPFPVEVSIVSDNEKTKQCMAKKASKDFQKIVK